MDIKKIVVADDSKMARTFGQRCLEISGCKDAEFIMAEDGAEGLKFTQEQVPDLIVSDLNMPNMTGTEFLAAVKSDDKLKHIPCIMVTSAGNPAKEKELQDLGALAIIHKPVAPPKLVPIISKLLAG